jgi:ferritin-like metal-binding protein YciE
MDKNTLKETCLEMLQDMYSAEKQIVEALPRLIDAAAYEDLKEAFELHLDETKGQVERLEEVFELLGVPPKEKLCLGMQGLLEEGEEIAEKKDLSNAFKDACLIIAAQKVEHYEIASYGSLCTILQHIVKVFREEEYQEILDLLKANLAEEKRTDEKLTELAEGTRTMEGINDEAEKEIIECCV